MAGNFSLLYTEEFQDSSEVSVTHDLNAYQVAVVVRVGNIARNDLIESVTVDQGDPRNALSVKLLSVCSGEVLILGADHVLVGGGI